MFGAASNGIAEFRVLAQSIVRIQLGGKIIEAGARRPAPGLIQAPGIHLDLHLDVVPSPCVVRAESSPPCTAHCWVQKAIRARA